MRKHEMVDAIFPCCGGYDRPEGCDAGILALILGCLGGAAVLTFFLWIKYKYYYEGYRRMSSPETPIY